MKKWMGLYLGVVSAFVLYFFESSVFTRLIFLFSLILLTIELVYAVKMGKRAKHPSNTEGKKKEFLNNSTNGFHFSDARPGTDTSETYGIREYRPGDSVRSIHWKLSEKTGKTMAREFSGISPEIQEETSIVKEDKEKNLNKAVFFGVINSLLLIVVSLFLKEISLSETGSLIPIILGIIVIVLSQLFTNYKKQLLFVVICIAVLLATIFIVPPFRTGGAVFINGIMKNSELNNRYSYVFLTLPKTGVKLQTAASLFFSAFAVIIALVFSYKSIVADAFMVLFLEFAACYFGVGGDSAYILVVFLLLLLFALTKTFYETERKGRKTLIIKYAVILSCFAIAGLLAGVGLNKTLTKTDGKVEQASEIVRDFFEPVTDSDFAFIENEDEEDRSLSSEGLLNPVEENTEGHNKYEEKIEEVTPISLPNIRREGGVLKGIIMSLLSLLLIILPFVPFIIINRIKSKIIAERNRFFSSNISEAISSIFPHLMDCVACLYDMEEKNFEDIARSVAEAENNEDYIKAFNIWQQVLFGEMEKESDDLKLLTDLTMAAEEKLKKKLKWHERLRLLIVE